MPLLDPQKRLELLEVYALKRFVDRERKTYVNKVREYRKIHEQLPPNHELRDPFMLAWQLKGYLQMYDEPLRGIMYGEFRTDDARIAEYYDRIAKYFVDLEAAGG